MITWQNLNEQRVEYQLRKPFSHHSILDWVLCFILARLWNYLQITFHVSERKECLGLSKVSGETFSNIALQYFVARDIGFIVIMWIGLKPSLTDMLKHHVVRSGPLLEKVVHTLN